MLSFPPGSQYKFLTSPPASSGYGKSGKPVFGSIPLSIGRGRSVMYLPCGFVVQFGLLWSLIVVPGLKSQLRWNDGVNTCPLALIAARNMLFKSGYVYGTLKPPVTAL